MNHVASSEFGAWPFCHERLQEQRKLFHECERTFLQLTIFKLLERPHQVKGFRRLRELQFPVSWFGEPQGTLAPQGVA